MRDLIESGRTVDFLRARKLLLALSALLVIAALGTTLTRGLNFGLDFTGGLLLEAAFPAPVNPEAVRQQLQASGHDGAVVQNFGAANQILIRMPADAAASAAQELLLTSLRSDHPGIDIQRVELVGPQVGAELAEQGSLALLIALLLILAYVSVRFQWKLALGAVAALAHDVIIVVGLFSLFGWTFDLAILAAILAVIGYSLNDTIVVFDRIRENFRKIRRGTPLEIVDVSINDTLSRTIMTSFATLLVLLALLFLGGETLWGFSMALTLGIVIGTYSSIYTASAVVVALDLSPADLQPPKVEEEEADSLP